jgi:hypothetical protein
MVQESLRQSRQLEKSSFRWCGRVAQLVEQCPFKAWVAGSNPAALTKISKHLADFGRVEFRHPRTPRASKTLVSTPWR